MSSSDELDDIAAAAHDASPVWAAATPTERATALTQVALALHDAQEELIAIGVAETGLSSERLRAELRRTCVQLGMFADVVATGAYLDVRIDEADPDFVLGVRPDLRRYRVPVGPVLNFAASNFPFAFSVAGGDTASALAAGCPVIVKTHSAHPKLSARTAEVVAGVFARAGWPTGVFQTIAGQADGVAMLTDRRVRAATFTGSTAVGRMLSDLASSRPRPIPFFGELGSVNPVVVTPHAIVARGDSIAAGFVASVSGSAGQLCTKPGFLFLPDNHDLETAIAERAAAVPEHRLLSPSISAAYRERREHIVRTPGVRVIAEGSVRVDDAGLAWVTPTVVTATLSDVEAHREVLLEETFGPFCMIVTYPHLDHLPDALEGLFEGNLTATLHLAPADDVENLADLIGWMAEHSGRVVFDGWPTGVSVTHAMQHGGPWPSTTLDSGTSVGSAGIERFLRGLTFQDAPHAALPLPLRDDNPWGVPQRRSSAASTHQWDVAS